MEQIYKIFNNGIEINRIVADEDFCKVWCNENGYTYEVEVLETSTPDYEQQPTFEEKIRADVDFIAAMTGVEL